MTSRLSKPADNRAEMQKLLKSWMARGWLRPLDLAFAEFLWREVPDAPPLAILAAALASHQLGLGHPCLDLAATLEDPTFALSLPPEEQYADAAADLLPTQVLAGLSLQRWCEALDFPGLVNAGEGSTPLVRIGTRLYLRRYWQYEQDVRAGIERRVEASATLRETLSAPDLRRTLDALFPRASTLGQTTDWQKVACALAAGSVFSIITGGPGTGKTRTVVRLLALLQVLALSTAGTDEAAVRPLRIKLAAPTGKAAARLNESISGEVAKLPLAELGDADALRAAIPVIVATVHRLLGSRPDTRHFRHHAGNPLAVDVLVIDEASMVDLEMMAAVLKALPAKARLILLGDKDQLASVEAGAVIGELCRRANDGHYTPATRDWLENISGAAIDLKLVDMTGSALDQAIVMLRHSYRFDANSGIGRLAEAVNAGDTAVISDIWNQDYPDLIRLPNVGNEDVGFKRLVIEGGHAMADDAEPVCFPESKPMRRGYRHYLETLQRLQPPRDADEAAWDVWADSVLKAHGQFQVLCALRRGPWGVQGLNQRIARLLQEESLIPASEGWYAGRPVLVTRNDYGLGLMNGDIGITLPLPGDVDEDWLLRVAFPAGDGTQRIKWILPSRLQAVETVYALTVHKSQGSEFDHVALILPEKVNPVLTRELLYTGITRAKSFLTLVNPGGDALLHQTVQRRVLRASGLVSG